MARNNYLVHFLKFSDKTKSEVMDFFATDLWKDLIQYEFSIYLLTFRCNFIFFKIMTL